VGHRLVGLAPLLRSTRSHHSRMLTRMGTSPTPSVLARIAGTSSAICFVLALDLECRAMQEQWYEQLTSSMGS
jgi:hypothetical protein